jgi:uncharacterized membrane protein YcaP (DUF421 family)
LQDGFMEKSVIPFDWTRLLLGEPPVGFLWEIVLRVVLIYGFALLMMQLMGKRARTQMNPLEFLVIIALGSATGDVMFYPEVPLAYAALVVAMLVLIGALVARVEARSERFRSLLESEPTVLIADGKLLSHKLVSERISRGELFSQLREAGVEHLGQVRVAILELSGRISVFKYPEGQERQGESVMPESVRATARAPGGEAGRPGWH